MKIGLGLLLVVLAASAAGCHDGTPSGPGVTDLTGTWSGTSSYPNAPFTLTLSQSGATLRGNYSDRLDRSLAVDGTFSSPNITLVVDFGDAKLHFTGRVVDTHTASGTMMTSALGNTPYPFTMTR